MAKKPPEYNDSKELTLNRLICDLDSNPMLHTDPVESSSYLGVELASSEEGFQTLVESKWNDFMNYINDFAKSCIDAGVADSVLYPTISRLLTQYKHSQAVFQESPLRMQWIEYSQNFVIPYSSSDYAKKKEQEYTRQAYRFFYKASAVQLLYLNRLVSSLTGLLNSSNATLATRSILDSNEPAEESEQSTTINPCFTIRVKARRYSHSVLQCLHKELKKEGYIDCSLSDFKGVFTSTNPKPIIWLKPYNHLSYLIKRMGENFIDNPYTQSNMMVAIRLFFNKTYGASFTPKRIRHDSDPCHNSKAFLDRAIKQSIGYLMS